jgi:hypothetical protein
MSPTSHKLYEKPTQAIHTSQLGSAYCAVSTVYIPPLPPPIQPTLFGLFYKMLNCHKELRTQFRQKSVEKKKM